jgi:predicted phosphoadenosine phosphosulfate sulfurtransferase
MKIKSGPLFLSALFFSSCATYHITTESLVKQLTETHKEAKTVYFVAFPIIVPFTVTGNSLTQIYVLDKNERECVIPVTTHTGVRITKNDDTRKTFYFNTLLIKDSLITGKNDHFIGANIKPINLNKIKKIELQR